MQAIKVPGAGSFFMKIEGFPTVEVKNFSVRPHDTSGIEKTIIGGMAYEIFGPGDGSFDSAIPRGPLFPWHLFNGLPPFDNILASFEPVSGVGPCWDAEGFQITNPGGPNQGETGPANIPRNFAFMALTPR